jgi:signal transduction histidine kinase
MTYARKSTDSILVVDDDPIVLEFMTVLLEQQGYRPIPCPGPLDALEKLEKDEVSLVLTDIVMPVLSGIDLIEKIHAIDPDLPVVLITGNADLEKAVLAIKRKAFDFILKPSRPDQIIHTVERALKFRRLIEVEKGYTRVLEDFNREVEDLVADRTKAMMGLSTLRGLRGPVRELLGVCRGVLLRTDLPEDLKKEVSLIAEKGEQMRRIERDCRVFAPAPGRGHAPEDLNSVVGEVLSVVATEAAQKEIDLSVEITNCPLMVRMARNLLKASLDHLVRNAIKFTCERGTVSVRTWAEGARVHLSVEDTGPGFPRATLKKIFDPFYFPRRLETGISLPLVKRIIVEHKGAISVTSKVGQGTRFIVSFPGREGEVKASSDVVTAL